MKKLLPVVSILLGILLLVAAGFYFLEPAKSLPAFFPGHDATLAKYHYKHGIGALLLGVGCFIFAWFNSSKKSS